MLHMFAMVFQVFQKHVSSISSISFCMMQTLYMDVLKIDRASATDRLDFPVVFLDSMAVSGGGQFMPCNSGQ
jgi:hypothetical protein